MNYPFLITIHLKSGRILKMELVEKPPIEKLSPESRALFLSKIDCPIWVNLDCVETILIEKRDAK
jgi:hypothetical protein